jgi:hypothetical protein
MKIPANDLSCCSRGWREAAAQGGFRVAARQSGWRIGSVPHAHGHVVWYA